MNKNYYTEIKENFWMNALKALGVVTGVGVAGGAGYGAYAGMDSILGALGSIGSKGSGSSTKPFQSRVNIDAARALSRGDDSPFTDYRAELQNSGMGLNDRTRALSRTKSEAANISRRNATKLKPLALSDKTEEGRAYIAARKAYEDAKKGGPLTITDPSRMTPEEKAQAMAAGDDASKASVTRRPTPQDLRKLREAEKAARKAALDRQYTIGELEDAGIQLEKVNFYKKIIAEQMAGEIPMGPEAGTPVKPEETSMEEENKKREAEAKAAQEAADKASADAETKRRSRTVSYTGTATRRNELSTPSAKFYSRSEATKDYPSGEQVMADQAERERQIRSGKISKTFKERGWDMPGTPEWDSANESPKDRVSRIQAELSAERSKIEAEERAKLDSEQPTRDADLADATAYNQETGNRGYTTPEQRDIGRGQRKIDAEANQRKREKERKRAEEMEAFWAELNRRIPGEKERKIAEMSPEERAAAMASAGDSESEAFFNLVSPKLPQRPARYPGGPGPVFDGPEPNYVEITPEEQFKVTTQNVKREVPEAIKDLETARENNKRIQQELEDLHNKHLGPLPFSIQNKPPESYIEISSEDKKEVERQRSVDMEAKIKKELERLEKERKRLESQTNAPKPPSLLAVPGTEEQIDPRYQLADVEDTIKKLLKQLQAGNLVER